MPKPSKAASLQLVRLRKEADVLFLLKREPLLRRALKDLNLRLTDTGLLLAVPLQACPFDGCPLPFEFRDLIQPAGRILKTAARKTAARKRTARKRTKPA